MPKSGLEGISSDLLTDYLTYAKQTGRAVEDVARQFDGLDEFEQLVDTVRAEAPQDYVASRWTYGVGSITVRPGAVDRVSRIAYGVQVNAAIEAKDLPTESDQLVLVSKVSEFLKLAGVSVEYAHFDIESRNVQVSVSRGSSAKQRLPAVAQEAIREAGVGIRVLSRHEAEPAVAIGGLAYSDCTGAFNVKAGSVRGISTAAHCTSKPSKYDGNSLGATSTYSGRDVRWARYTTGTASNSFRWNTGLYRQVTSSGNPTIGSLACKDGRSTAYHCATVTESGFEAYGYTALYKTYDGEGRVRPGDSGGPWFRDSKGLGVTSGRIYYRDTTVADLFSGIGSLNLMGVTVITS